jgi:hypothetical protein
MSEAIYVHDRAVAQAATALIDSHGAQAAKEAHARANSSRNIGNVINFCKWRQVKRLITEMENRSSAATLH